MLISYSMHRLLRFEQERKQKMGLQNKIGKLEYQGEKHLIKLIYYAFRTVLILILSLSHTHTSFWAHLQVSVHYAHVMQILHSVQDLLDELAGVFLRVKTFFHNPVKELAARHPAKGEICCGSCARTHTYLHFRQTVSQHGLLWPAGGVPALLHQQEALLSSFSTSYSPLTQVKVDSSVNQRNILLCCKSSVIMCAICFLHFNLL